MEWIRLQRDSLSSYADYSTTEKEILEDDKGKYRIHKVRREVPCDCHPETCCHFDGKVMQWYDEKIYLPKDGTKQ